MTRTRISTMLLTLLTCLLLTFSTALAASVHDGAKLLKDDQKAALEQKIQQVEAAHQVKIGIVTMKSLKGASPAQTANTILDKQYAGGKNGSIVLLLAMDSRDFHVSTDSTMRQIITDDGGFPHLREAFLPALKENHYYQAFDTYVATTDELLAYYEKEGEPFDPANQFSPLALVIAILLGVLAALGVKSGLESMMSNVAYAPSADAYLKDDSVDITESNDLFLYTTETRRPKPKKSSSGGGGGGSHGGGGGKF